jgi:hypothetical protein
VYIPGRPKPCESDLRLSGMSALQIIPIRTVELPPEPADRIIARSIERWLLRIARPSRRFINVEVRDGVVTLSGVVRSRRTRAHIHAMVRQVPGVTGLRDSLRVHGIRRHRTLELPAGISMAEALRRLNL